jgi:hypothetical protein
MKCGRHRHRSLQFQGAHLLTPTNLKPGEAAALNSAKRGRALAAERMRWAPTPCEIITAANRHGVERQMARRRFFRHLRTDEIADVTGGATGDRHLALPRPPTPRCPSPLGWQRSPRLSAQARHRDVTPAKCARLEKPSCSSRKPCELIPLVGQERPAGARAYWPTAHSICCMWGIFAICRSAPRATYWSCAQLRRQRTCLKCEGRRWYRWPTGGNHRAWPASIT